MTKNDSLIQYRDRARQVIDFADMRYGSITPTDIDGLIEYHNKALVFYEVKHGDAVMPYGQELALTRLADNCEREGKKSLVIHCTHDVDDSEQDVNLAECKVSRYYWNGKWHKGKGTAKSLTDRFINWVNTQ